MDFLTTINPETVIIIAILIFSIIIHEISHGYAALFLGDDTAERAGRLTLNPIPHIDLVGSIIIPAFLVLASSPFFFGYAKPVPYNPNNLRNKKWGDAIVAFAGPLSNLILAFIFVLASFILFLTGNATETSLYILQIAAFMNIVLAILNLIPVPPLDGSKVFLDILKNFWFELYRIVNQFFMKYEIFLLIVALLFILSTNILAKLSYGILEFYQSILF